MPSHALLAVHVCNPPQAFDLEGDEVLGAAPYVETPLFSCLEATGLSVNTVRAGMHDGSHCGCVAWVAALSMSWRNDGSPC